MKENRRAQKKMEQQNVERGGKMGGNRWVSGVRVQYIEYL